MADAQYEKGKQWARRAFNRIRSQHILPVRTILPNWRVGDKFKDARQENANNKYSGNYYILFRVDDMGEDQYIEFTLSQFENCSDPRDTESRSRLENHIRRCLDEIAQRRNASPFP